VRYKHFKFSFTRETSKVFPLQWAAVELFAMYALNVVSLTERAHARLPKIKESGGVE